MRTFDIIPAIDLVDGKCVRLSQGDYDSCTVYSEKPLDVVLAFENAGIKRVHIVDLDGAKKGTPVNLEILELIAQNTKLTIDFGGGISGDRQAQDAFNAGAAMLSVGSLAAKQPGKFREWLKNYGADKFLLAADVKDEQVKINGWQQPAGFNIYDFIELFINDGLKNIFCTDITCDGMLQGPNQSLYKKIMKRYLGLNVIASGGVSALDDIYELKSIGCAGAIVGKALYEKRISLDNLTKLSTYAR